MHFTKEDLNRAMGSLSLLAYHPLNDPDSRSALMEELARMCPSLEALEYLIRRALQLHSKWPGLRELRAILCGGFKPADGVEAYSEVYPDGIPAEFPAAQEVLALPPGQPGHDASAAPELEGMVARLAQGKALPTPCCDPITGRTMTGEFCSCRIGQLARQLAGYQTAQAIDPEAA